MSTVKDVWGFSTMEIAKPDTDTTDRIAEFCTAMNAAALDRGIKPNVPSDALDLSRDICLDEAAQSLGLEWEIVGDTLRAWPVGVTIQWL